MATTTYPKNMKKTIVDEELRKAFQEKRKARFDEIQEKIKSQREKRTASNENLTKISSARKIVPSSARKPVTTSKTSTTPQIKMTKASQLRLEKNNPLAKYKPEEIEKLIRNQSEDTKKVPGSVRRPNFRTSPCANNMSASSVNRSSRIETRPNTTARTVAKPPLRRSISAMHIKNKSLPPSKRPMHLRGIPKAHSAENISIHNEINVPSPIIEENEPQISRTGQKAVMFMTPNNPPRKSSQFLPGRTPAPSELRERLLSWLKKRGKSLNAYSHLRCFGVHQSTPYRPAGRSHVHTVVQDEEDENKENRPELAPAPSTSDFVPKVVDYTNFTNDNDLFGTPNPNTDDKKLAQEALCDLHALILEKYPEDQCNAWLSALQKKYPHLQDQPQYWECRAALGELNGEFNEAVECYQQAIISGAEIKKIDHSIERLLEKFSVLDLDTSTKKQDTKAKKQRSKIILDARNVFKSSVIKFAVQQRESRLTRKNQDPSTPLVAKPVRRSTRFRKSVFTQSTPVNNEKLYNSINEIETSIGHVSFQTNRALFEQ